MWRIASHNKLKQLFVTLCKFVAKWMMMCFVPFFHSLSSEPGYVGHSPLFIAVRWTSVLPSATFTVSPYGTYGVYFTSRDWIKWMECGVCVYNQHKTLSYCFYYCGDLFEIFFEYQILVMLFLSIACLKYRYSFRCLTFNILSGHITLWLF